MKKLPHELVKTKRKQVCKFCGVRRREYSGKPHSPECIARGLIRLMWHVPVAIPKLSNNMLAMLQKVKKGDQPNAGVVTKAQIRSAGNTLRALLRAGLLAMDKPFVYVLTEKGRKALESKS